MLSRTRKNEVSKQRVVASGAILSLALLGIFAPTIPGTTDETDYEYFEDADPENGQDNELETDELDLESEYFDESHHEDDSVSDESDFESLDLNISVEYSEAYPGELIVVSGSGFSPEGTVEIDIYHYEFGSVSPELETSSADQEGNFTHSLTIPHDIAPGTYELWVEDTFTQQSDWTTLDVIDTGLTDSDVEINPAIEVGPKVAHAGETIHVQGNGFTPDKSATVVFENQDAVSVNTDRDGHFLEHIDIPVDAVGGQYSVTAIDSGGNSGGPTDSVYVLTTDYALEQYDLTLIADTETVAVGDTVLLTLTGPEHILAEHGADLLVPKGLLLDRRDASADFIDTRLELSDSGQGYRVYAYEVPGYQPVGPARTQEGQYNSEWDDIGAIEPGVSLHFESKGIVEVDYTTVQEFESSSVRVVVQDSEAAESADPMEQPADGVESEQSQPTLSVDRSEVHLDDFVGQPDDGAGVRHTVEGLEPGLDVTYTVQSPDSIENFSGEGSVTEDGIMTFVVHGFEHSTPSIYVGDYTTTVEFNDQDGNLVELSDQFAVVGDSAAVVVPAQVEPAQLGTDLAKTGLSNTALVLIAAALLVVGILIAAFARHRRLSRPQV